MILSVVIPTRNRSALLARTLEHIAAVDYPPAEFEVIVVDTGSTDNTKQVCEQVARAHIRHFVYECSERPGLHIGRHRGARVAGGDVLVYGDDDIRPCRTWLAAIRESFADERVALVGGNDLPDFEVGPPAWFDRLWQTTIYGRYLGCFSLLDFGDRPRHVPPEYVFGCNFAIRKAALLKAGGFHPDGMPRQLLRYRGDGETAVSRAIAARGLLALFHPRASVYHYVSKERMTPAYVFERGYAQGISDSYTLIRARGGLSHEKRWRDRGIEALQREWRALKGKGWELAARITDSENPWLAYRRGHRAGFSFHHEEVRRDSSLLDWVLQPDYWDESTSPSV